MAKATFNQPSVSPRSTPLLRSAVVLSALVGLGLIFSGPTAILISGGRRFLEYYAGVFTLVSLSITVMVGLVATDRMVLTIRHRILLQAAHRGTALASLAFLGIHIALKILEDHAGFVDIVAPFLASHRAVFIGFGTIASNLMVIVGCTGLIRGRFAGTAHPGFWRVLHALAYVAWPFALVHGLESGRQAKTWVTVSYVACVVFVVLALLVRVCLTLGKRRRAPKATTSGTIRAVGKPVPGSEPPRFAPLAPPRPAPDPPRHAPEPPRRVPMPPRWVPTQFREEPTPLREEPTPLREEPAVRHWEPDQPVQSRYEELGPHGVRGPVSRGRLARAARAAEAAHAADARPRHGADLTDSGMLRDRVPHDRMPEEPVTAPAAWRSQPAEDGTGDSPKPPRLTFLDEDETPDPIPSDPPHARPANWDEPAPFGSPADGRHSGEYQVLPRASGYRPTWQAALEPAPAHTDHDHRRPDSPPHGWPGEPATAAPAKRRRSRRRHEATVEVTETPTDPPATRKPAAVLTDEEFWAHMRGDALR